MAKIIVLGIVLLLIANINLMMVEGSNNPSMTEIWFGPLQHQNSDEYIELFTKLNEWEKARTNVDIFMMQFSFQDDTFFNKLKSEDAFRILSDEGVDIALEAFIAQPGNPDLELSCDSNKEADKILELIKNIRSEGGNVKYINMVEPLYEMMKREGSIYADNTIAFGIAGDLAITGDWDGDGKDTIGIYRPSAKKFILSNSNNNPKTDISFVFNETGDLAITGDWDGDGKDTIGVYNKQYSTFKLRNSNTDGKADLIVSFGVNGDVPVTGDWDGDGKDTIGLHRGCNFILSNSNNNPLVDKNLCFGVNGDVPVTGDWDGDGIDTVGVYRAASKEFYLKKSYSNNNIIKLVAVFGLTGDIPLSGDWDGDGNVTIGIYRSSVSTFRLVNSFSMENLCNYTPEIVADETKKFVDKIKSYDSSIIVGSVEAMPSVNIDELESWIKSSKRKGVDVPYVYLDFNLNRVKSQGWTDDQIESFIQELESMLKSNDVELGIVMNSNWSSRNDKGYYDNTMSWIQTVKESIGTPEKASFESWGDSSILLPSAILPETQQYSFTKMINDGWDVITSDICGNGRCESGETETNCQEDCSISNTNCMGNGKDQDGLCNIDCDADESCDGKSPLSTLESCGEFGNDAVLDRCSSSCEVEDKPDNICRKSGIADCTGDDECNGKEIETYNCDEYCNYIEPVCGDSICDFGENSGNCADDCSDIKEESCGDDNCSDDENCGDCPEDCGYCGADLDSDYDAINEGDGLNDNATYDGLTYKNNSEDSEANAGINKIKGNIFFNKIKCILKSIFLFKDYGECMASAV